MESLGYNYVEASAFNKDTTYENVKVHWFKNKKDSLSGM